MNCCKTEVCPPKSHQVPLKKWEKEEKEDGMGKAVQVSCHYSRFAETLLPSFPSSRTFLTFLSQVILAINSVRWDLRTGKRKDTTANIWIRRHSGKSSSEIGGSPYSEHVGSFMCEVSWQDWPLWFTVKWTLCWLISHWPMEQWCLWWANEVNIVLSALLIPRLGWNSDARICNQCYVPPYVEDVSILWQCARQ